MTTELLASIATSLEARCAQYIANDDTLGLIAVCRAAVALATTVITRFGMRSHVEGSPALTTTQQKLTALNDALLPFVESRSIYLQTSVGSRSR